MMIKSMPVVVNESLHVFEYFFFSRMYELTIYDQFLMYIFHRIKYSHSIFEYRLL